VKTSYAPQPRRAVNPHRMKNCLTKIYGQQQVVTGVHHLVCNGVSDRDIAVRVELVDVHGLAFHEPILV
jgi:hypothetical protein